LLQNDVAPPTKFPRKTSL